jgi:hypothetical protein
MPELANNPGPPSALGLGWRLPGKTASAHLPSDAELFSNHMERVCFKALGSNLRDYFDNPAGLLKVP